MAEPSSSDTGDLARVRQALMRELESVNTFESMARQSTQPQARAALEALAQRARENVAALTGALRLMDAQQEAAFVSPGLPIVRTAAPSSAAPASGPAAKVPTVLVNGKGEASFALVDELRLPTDPERLIHALPAPPNPHAGQLTVGSLRGKK